MFYEPRNFEEERDALFHNPLRALVVPRPIGWVSTVSKTGRPNLAPFSAYNLVSLIPPLLMFAPAGPSADGRPKDTLINCQDTKEFVVNLAVWDLRHQMNMTSTPVPREVSEFAYSGLTPEPCRLVKAPRVKESPAAFECRLFQIIHLPNPFPDWPSNIVIGEVVGVHISEFILTDGLVDVSKLKPLARLGYLEDFAVVESSFRLQRLAPDPAKYARTQNPTAPPMPSGRTSRS